MSFEYDLFISYSSKDVDWATMLVDKLPNRIVVWRDKERLIAGRKWEKDIVEKLRRSQHMIILWSEKSAGSDWVRRERGVFEAVIDDTQPGQPERLLMFLELDDTSNAFASLQGIDDVKAAKAYAAGPSSLSPANWQSIVDKIISAIQSQDKSTPIPTAILAATQTEIQAIEPTILDSLVQGLNLTDKQALFDFYSPRGEGPPNRLDWRPFGNTDSIATILERQQNAINLETGDPQFRWDFVKDDFWDDIEAARGYALLLREKPSLIVLDPISLSVPKVRDRANLLKKCLANNETAVLAPMPFRQSAQFTTLRALLRDTGAPLLDEYYFPPVREAGPVALFGLGVGDEEDTKRLILATLAQYVRRLTSSSGSAYLRQKGG